MIRSNQQLSEFRLVGSSSKVQSFRFFSKWLRSCVFLQRDGGRSDRDVWRSRNAEFFYGCSNASTKFPSALLSLLFISCVIDLTKVGNFELLNQALTLSYLFADAKAVTRNDRYLAIATSGGLNQQRTGVSSILLLWFYYFNEMSLLLCQLMF